MCGQVLLRAARAPVAHMRAPQDWLVRSGRIREVADLVRLHKENEAGAAPAGGGEDVPSPFSKPLASPPRGARRDVT